VGAGTPKPVLLASVLQVPASEEVHLLGQEASEAEVASRVDLVGEDSEATSVEVEVVGGSVVDVEVVEEVMVADAAASATNPMGSAAHPTAHLLDRGVLAGLEAVVLEEVGVDASMTVDREAVVGIRIVIAMVGLVVVVMGAMTRGSGGSMGMAMMTGGTSHDTEGWVSPGFVCLSHFFNVVFLPRKA
jgi:hypothetical protein